jgi:C1A family cysteine protease
MGYIPDLPSIRDYSIHTNDINARQAAAGEKSVASLLLSTGALYDTAAIPSSVDLRQWCSPIEDQMDLGSCTSMAAVGMIEYFERKAHGKHVDLSKLFVYKISRQLAHLVGDSGSYIRTTMQALAAFGAPPEEYWPYTTSQAFDNEPSPFTYAFAQNYKAISYFRLDTEGSSPQEVLKRIKKNLAAKIPSMFGFTVYASYEQADTNGGLIPFPSSRDNIVGGHAVMAVGYDDSMRIANSAPGSAETVGAFLIRNSWGTGWGVGGYGWLPYQYVLSGLAVDWWGILKTAWIDSNQFVV